MEPYLHDFSNCPPSSIAIHCWKRYDRNQEGATERRIPMTIRFHQANGQFIREFPWEMAMPAALGWSHEQDAVFVLANGQIGYYK